MKKQATTVEQINFNKLRRDLQTLMEEVDRRLASEFEAFSPTWVCHRSKPQDQRGGYADSAVKRRRWAMCGYFASSREKFFRAFAGEQFGYALG